MSASIEELAKRKVELQQTLQAISYCNVYGKTNQELIDLEMRSINTHKELVEINSQIENYISGSK